MPDYIILVKAKVDEAPSSKSINESLKNIQKNVQFTISNIKIDPNALNNLQMQISGALGKATEGTGKSRKIKGLEVGLDYSEASSAMKTLSNDVERIRSNFSSLGNNVNVTKLFDQDGIRQYSVSVENIADGMKTIDTYGIKIAKNGEQTITSMKGIEKAVTATKASTKDLSILTQTYQEKLRDIRISHKDAYKSDEVKKLDVAAQNLITSLDGTRNASDKADLGLRKLRNGVKSVEEAARTTTSATDNFITTLTKDIGKVLLWSTATGAVYGLVHAVSEGVQYLKDLDKELTNIQLVSGQTSEEVYKLADSFNKMAKELGATTLDMAKGATTWIRQGKSMKDTMELLRISTMLSKLGDLEAAEATEKLTAVMNGYRLETSEAIKVTDTLIALDNSLATSTKAIVDGMSKASSMANAAGVSYQNLATYIGVVQSVTQQSGDTVGQAFSR